MLTDYEQMVLDLKSGETRQVEFKQWMDITKGEGQIKIARSISALSNSGGGRLYFGIDDDGNALPPDANHPLSNFSADVMHVMLKKHVGDLECQVRPIEYNGVEYPLVIVPRHGDVPWIARDKHGNLTLYVRSIKPEVVPPTTRQQWDELLHSLMEVRGQRAVRSLEDGLVARTQEIARLVATELQGGLAFGATPPKRPDWNLIEALAEDTRTDFVQQVGRIEFEEGLRNVDQELRVIAEAQTNNIVAGYALLTESYELVAMSGLLEKLRYVNRLMVGVAYSDWSDFLTLTESRVAPRYKYWEIADRSTTGVEGARNDQKRVVSSRLDYWRAYANGVFAICKNFEEDFRETSESQRRYLTTTMVFIRAHSLLAHAGAMARLVPEARKIALFSRPAGMANRLFKTGSIGDESVLGTGVSSDRFPTNCIVDADELDADYIGALCRWLNEIADPLANRVGPGYFSRGRVEQMFNELNERLSVMRPLPPRDHN